MQNSSASVTNWVLRILCAIKAPALRYTTLHTMNVFKATWKSKFGRGETGLSVSEVVDEEGSSISLSRLSLSL